MRIRLLILAVLILTVLCACANREQAALPNVSRPAQSVPGETQMRPGPEVAPEKPLMAETESREAAEELAQLYGITLVDFREGIATFYTEEDPRAVIERGRNNGWQELYLNQVDKPF